MTLARRRSFFASAGARLVATLVLGAGLGLSVGMSAAGASGPEGVPIQHVPDLASADTTSAGAPVDGITCRTAQDQVVKYHIHVHVDIFVNGKQRRIPAGIGIPTPRLNEHLSTGLFEDNGLNGCLYWLHVHSNDGVIHVESPTKQSFTLGQFFDIWQQPLAADHVGPAKGAVVAFVNGKRFAGNPRDISLLPHEVLQIDVGRPVVPFQPVHFMVNGLCSSSSTGCAVPTGS